MQEGSIISHFGKGKGMEVEEGTYGYENLKVHYPWANLKIGKFCSIAKDVNIILGGEHHVDWVTTYGFGQFKDLWGEDCPLCYMTFGDVVVGNDVLISYGVTILSGVTIGDGAVIAAGALVNKNIPPYTVVGGVPAKVLKYRFTEDQIARLLKIAWWNRDEDWIRAHVKLLNNADIELFLRTVEDEDRAQNS